jgi:histidyl-tRNA synthetase
MAPLEEADLPRAAQLAEQLREQMIRVELDVRLRGARGALRHADRVGIPLVVLVGERERDAGEVVLRVMKERRECHVGLEQLAGRIASELNKGSTDGQG